MCYPLIRRYTTSPGRAHRADPADQRQPERHAGGGGTCFGDSGGPVFHGGYVVAVTSYGYTENCRYLGGYQRVDIPTVQDWLNNDQHLIWESVNLSQPGRATPQMTSRKGALCGAESVRQSW